MRRPRLVVRAADSQVAVADREQAPEPPEELVVIAVLDEPPFVGREVPFG